MVGDSATLADYSLSTGLSIVLTVLGEEERKAYPNLTAWYLSLVETDPTIGTKDLPKEAHKAFKPKHEKKEKCEKKKRTQGRTQGRAQGRTQVRKKRVRI